MRKRWVKWISVLLLIIMMHGCLHNKKVTYNTSRGIELSQSLSKTILFLETFQASYMTLANLTIMLYRTNQITEQQFNTISTYADKVRVEFETKRFIILGWYDAETNGIIPEYQDNAAEYTKSLFKTMQGLIGVIQEESKLSNQDQQMVMSLLAMMEIFIIGGVQ
jgi:hypothetical protein